MKYYVFIEGLAYGIDGKYLGSVVARGQDKGKAAAKAAFGGKTYTGADGKTYKLNDQFSLWERKHEGKEHFAEPSEDLTAKKFKFDDMNIITIKDEEMTHVYVEDGNGADLVYAFGVFNDSKEVIDIVALHDNGYFDTFIE